MTPISQYHIFVRPNNEAKIHSIDNIPLELFRPTVCYADEFRMYNNSTIDRKLLFLFLFQQTTLYNRVMAFCVTEHSVLAALQAIGREMSQ